MRYYLLALSNYVNFSGRARRSEYWLFVLYNIIFSLVAKIIDTTLGYDSIHLNEYLGLDSKYSFGGPIFLAYNIAVALPALSLLVRRMHDVGKSGWFPFIISIGPPIGGGLIALSVWLFNHSIGISLLGPLVVGTSLISVIWLCVLLCTDGTIGENKYGPDPKMKK
jgi:uncharacterized membrane protein YhaH (DUF805 family)